MSVISGSRATLEERATPRCRSSRDGGGEFEGADGRERAVSLRVDRYCCGGSCCLCVCVGGGGGTGTEGVGNFEKVETSSPASKIGQLPTLADKA